MTRSSIQRLVGLVVAVIVGVALYWLVGNVGLAAVAGTIWGIGIAIVLYIARQYPSRVTGTAWTDKRWTGLGVGLVTLASLVGVSPTLPISADLRLALGILVLGAGTVGYVTGSVAEMEREAD